MKKIVLITLGIVLALCVCASGFYLFKVSSIRKDLAITGDRGVDEAGFVTIGGIPQYLYARGQDRDNPVMLFLHGGPGTPELSMLYAFQPDWESRVTVVHWDQRGCGKTWTENDPDAVKPTITYEQLISDTREIVSYLCEKFNKEKIIVLGHSWGTVLGSGFVQRYPGQVLAYIAVGSVVNFHDNERVGYEEVLKRAQSAGDTRTIRELESVAPYPPEQYGADVMEKIGFVRGFQMKYGLATGADAKMVSLVGFSPLYELKDKFTLVSSEVMEGQNELMKFLYTDFDLRKSGLRYEMPVFYIQGADDWQTPTVLVQEIYPDVAAPMKELRIIPDAGHFTMIDQKDSFTHTLFEILELL